MFDILGKLIPSLSNEEESDLTPEEEEAQAKRDRIKFHREKVRNGPTSFRHVTDGMIRRARARDLERRTRKTHRKQVRNYFATQRLAAVVRGQLQLAGILPYVYERDLDRHQQVRSVIWLTQRFGVGEGGEVSYAHDNVLLALAEALKFYGQAVGLPNLQIPADYVVPVYEAA